ncbi:MAG: hypothetical protein HFG43_00685 [Lachnospiraceae bacterium]|nr:hypothetical protein [Lachnospiraceae bacterium]MCI9592244.1 hypothetical protein [Lachnospiraceae bacterium]
MSKTSKKTVLSQPMEEKKYPTKKLLKSRHLAGYQRDFAKVILTKPEYSISEAVETLDMSFKKGGK